MAAAAARALVLTIVAFQKLETKKRYEKNFTMLPENAAKGTFSIIQPREAWDGIGIWVVGGCGFFLSTI